jgi:uncharacterized damage-inducible protein DinB
MARYGAWQNHCHATAMATLDEAELWRDRGAFFGSILGTANHLILGDRLWLHRLAGDPVPQFAGRAGTETYPDFATWRAERQRTDARLIDWADGLVDADLSGDLVWHSIMMGRDMTTPRVISAMHLFNHGTHHRGQIHAMLTAAGVPTEDTDIPLMPEEGPWLS